MMTDQIDITKMTVEELWKIAFEQQKAVTQLFAQLSQTQANVAAIEAEIAKRDGTPPDKKV